MPEKIETELVARELNTAISNKILLSITLNEKSRYFGSTIPGSDLITYPSKCISVYSRGKRIIFEMENCYILSFLGMTGKFIYKPGNHSGLVLKFNDIIVYYDDVRHFGYLKIYKTKTELDAYLDSTIGPDWLNDNVTLEYFETEIKNKRRKNTQICQFLLNQKIIAGLGNYLKAEVLYRSKIRPDRKLGELKDTEIRVLYEVIVETLQEALAANGLTIRDYISPSGLEGKFKCLVYGKDKDPNGHVVIKEKFKDKRNTWWCREVQV